MIQDIAPHQYHAAYSKTEAKEDDIIFIYQEGGVLCRMEDGCVFYPTVKEVSKVVPDVCEKADYLFGIDEAGYFELRENRKVRLDGYRVLKKEELRRVKPIWTAYAGITGFQIHKWHMENQFCGCCGAKMRLEEKERAMRCLDCGNLVYPKICPCVIVGIVDGDKLLMTKYAAGRSSFQKYALVAGYVEVGESLEDAVRREVMEEVGLNVRNIRYYKSQPWSFTDTLLAGFFCEADGDGKISMDREELSEAEWFDWENLPAERSEASISLTGEMIEAFREYKKRKG